MDDESLYWIALNLLPFSPRQVRDIHLQCGSSEALASSGAAIRDAAVRDPPLPEGGARDWWSRVIAGELGYASPLSAAGLDGERLLEAAREESRRAASLGVRILTLASPAYPSLLAGIAAPPPVLYLMGEEGASALLDQTGDGPSSPPRAWWWGGDGSRSPAEPSPREPVCIGVVGSRRATDYGRAVSRRLGRTITRAGAIVVSGLAHGIDAEAHTGAIEADGCTLAVLGCGLAVPAYPRVNAPLARRLLRRGALLSEFALDTPPTRPHFPRRNRIIAGLCPAVAVVEAAERSGALITARLALEEGREVLAVPGRITDAAAGGTNGLLRAGAAAVMSREEDVLEELPAFWRERLAVAARAPAPEGGSATAPPDVSPAEAQVLSLLKADEPVSMDRLLARSGRPAADVLAALVGLEIRAFVRSLPGGRYILNP
jgi:DNA processing protein